MRTLSSYLTVYFKKSYQSQPGRGGGGYKRKLYTLCLAVQAGWEHGITINLFAYIWQLKSAVGLTGPALKIASAASVYLVK